MTTFVQTFARHKVGIVAVAAFAVVAFAHHGWFAG